MFADNYHSPRLSSKTKLPRKLVHRLFPLLLQVDRGWAFEMRSMAIGVVHLSNFRVLPYIIFSFVSLNIG